MKAYSIFDDFGRSPAEILTNANVELTIHPFGKNRPDDNEMKQILTIYDCVIIGTSQKINEHMFDDITSPKIIATASVGLDHIHVPDSKKHLIQIINTPEANAQSVAEYTIGCALRCCKRLTEGNDLYRMGKNNKCLSRKPEDLYERSIGIIGAGNVSVRIMEYADIFGMKIFCWTAHPKKHQDLKRLNVEFVELNELVQKSDVISVALPNKHETQGLISAELVNQMKESAIFISVSRLEIVDLDALLKKAISFSNFYVCLDIDVDESVVKKLPKIDNFMVTPHIAGGTVETRKRMFLQVAQQIADIAKKQL